MILSEAGALTYGEFLEFSGKLGLLLSSKGVQPGDRVISRCRNKHRFCQILFALMLNRVIAVPVDTPESRIQEQIINDALPALIIADQDLAFSTEVEVVSVEDVVSAERHRQIRYNNGSFPDLDDPALILFTSGTEGRRKGVLLSHRSVVSVGVYQNEFMQVEESIREYVSSPIDHAFGFGRCRSVFCAGGAVVLQDGALNPLKMFKSIKHHSCNGLSGVSTAFGILVDGYAEQLREISGQCRWIEMGSIGLEASKKRELSRLLPHTKCIQNYGLSESQRSTFLDLHAEADFLESSGKPRGPVRVKIINEDGQAGLPGEVGRICVSGPQLAVSYWKQEKLWKERFSEGWLRTTDLAYMNKEGYLFFVSRADEIINIGGEKVSPTSIEESIRGYLDLPDFGVCGFPDPDGGMGEIPVIVFESDSWNAEEGWKGKRNALRGKLPLYAIPKRAYLVKKFPRTGTGKLQRIPLRKLLEEGKGTALL